MRINWWRWILSITAMLLLLAAGCQSPPSTTTGQPANAFFRHRWWNYYERGLSYTERGFHAEAAADLKAAIVQRDRDQRMARTYGMHFVDYFPHRELGVLYWEMRQPADAQLELETSISQAPTAKAFYYLDRVREFRIRQQMKEGAVQTPPPTIRIDAPQKGFRTREDHVVIRGMVSDNNYIDVVMVDGKAVYLEGARQTVAFHQTLDLAQGSHLIRIRVGSLSGLSSRKDINIHVDRQGPIVVVQAGETVKDGPREYRVLVGRVMDPSGVASLLVNRTPVNIPAGTDLPFHVNLDEKTVVVGFSAEDRLGNTTRIHFDLNEGAGVSHAPQPILLASSGPMISLVGLIRKPDPHAPSIQLKGWTASQIVYMDKVVIEGGVRDNQQIANIFINGQPIAKTPLIGMLAAFSCSIRLNVGENVISVEAVDVTGNRTVEKIVIVRRTPAARLLRERLRMSVLPFAQQGEITAAGVAFQDVFIQQLMMRNRFNIVDRTLLDIILQEHKINRTDLIAPDTALRTGRLASADAFIKGSIIETRLGTEVISQMVDTETSEVLTVVDAFIETKSLADAKEAAEQLALKFHREFPLINGEIIDCRDQYVITNLGEEQLRAQRKILVIEEQPILHPVTHHPLGSDYHVLGRARLVQIQKDFSKGELLEVNGSAINRTHGIITQ